LSRLESFNPYGLDISEAKKSNIMITGLTGSGKTRLAWAHADKLMKNGFQVLVVDPIGVWRDSPLPYFVKVTPLSRINLQLITTGKSIVYDISQLLIGKQLEFLDTFTDSL